MSHKLLFCVLVVLHFTGVLSIPPPISYETFPPPNPYPNPPLPPLPPLPTYIPYPNPPLPPLPTYIPILCPNISCPRDCQLIQSGGDCPRCECEKKCGICPPTTQCKEVYHGCDNPSSYEPCDPFLSWKCMPECPLINCNIRCSYGLLQDSKGCVCCECLPNPCHSEGCPYGQTCTPFPNPLASYPPYVSNCKTECPHLRCKDCLSGNIFDKNGCKTCQCKEPCEGITCSYGRKCVPRPSGSKPRYSCLYIKKACPYVRCIKCLSGYMKDRNGCKTCQCKNPCEISYCPYDQKCIPKPSRYNPYSCVSRPKVYSVISCPKSCAGLWCGKMKTCCAGHDGCYGCKSRRQCFSLYRAKLG